MSVIIIPRKHLRQPHGRVTVDPRFAPGFAWLPQDGGTRTSRVSNILGTAQRCGVATSGVVESAAEYINAVGGRSSFGQQPQWMVIGGRFPNLSAPARLFGCGRPSTAKQSAGLQIMTSGAIEFFVYTGVWKTYTVAASQRSDGTFLVGHSLDDAGILRVFLNGQQIGEQAGWTSLPVPDTDPTFGMVYASSTNPNLYGNGTEVSFAAFGNTGDVSGTALQLTANPWQLFRADPVRIYSLPSGPISVSWSSLTASNITQTGATLTLGGITR